MRSDYQSEHKNNFKRKNEIEFKSTSPRVMTENIEQKVFKSIKSDVIVRRNFKLLFSCKRTLMFKHMVFAL
jgi:hypothetical protein